VSTQTSNIVKYKSNVHIQRVEPIPRSSFKSSRVITSSYPSLHPMTSPPPDSRFNGYVSRKTHRGLKINKYKEQRSPQPTPPEVDRSIIAKGGEGGKTKQSTTNAPRIIIHNNGLLEQLATLQITPHFAETSSLDLVEKGTEIEVNDHYLPSKEINIFDISI